MTMRLTKEQKLARWAGVGTAALLALGAVQARAEAVLSVTSGDNRGCYDLLAGQTIDAGDVCFSVIENGQTLLVSYTTEGSWQLTEAHLWVGKDQDGYPRAKNGNPKVGNFPYNSGNITGATTHNFYVPLGSVQSVFEHLDDLDQYCGQSTTIYAMAHAAVRLLDGSGTVVQTETGWGEGEGAVQKGSWATRTAITLSVTCHEEPPPPPPTIGQETAIMVGNIVLNNNYDDICVKYDESGNPMFKPNGVPEDEFSANRWGWQDGPLAEGTYENEIWAAAGNNVLGNGTHVGQATISVTSGHVEVTVDLFDGFTAEATHIYVGTTPVCSGAFGTDWNSAASTNIDTSNGVYVGVHLSVEAACGINPDSLDNFCEPTN